MKLVCVLITLMCILIDTYYALPDGAPQIACFSLMPDHDGRTPQNRASMYEISAVKFGNKVKVKILARYPWQKFQGFMLQARSAGNPSIFIDGEFTTSEESKTIDCFEGVKNTLTHVNTTSKELLITEWTPKKATNEFIIFRATIAKDYSQFWTEVDSPRIKLSDGSEEDLDRHPAYDGCFVNKGCFAYPEYCIQEQNCDILFTWEKPAGDRILFALHGCIDSIKNMALSFSEDTYLSDDSVTECSKDGDNIVIRETLEDKDNTRTREFPKDSYGVSVTDGLITCAWTRPYHYESLGQTYDLLKTNYIILVTRKIYYGGPGSYPFQSSVSGGPINFTAISDFEDACDFDSPTMLGNGSAKYPYTEPDKYDPRSMCPGEIRSADKAPNCVSQLRFSLFSVAILWLFFAAGGILY